MATFKDLQDRINLDYLNNMTLAVETRRAIVNAIHCYETHRFWFNEGQTAVALTASQSYLAVPADFMQLDRLEVNYGGGYERLIETNFSSLREMNITASQNQPTHYVYRGDRFELAPIPNSAYPAIVYYVKSLPTLSADSDSNAWTNEAQNLIAHAATLDLLSGVLQVQDQRKIDRHLRGVQMAFTELGTRNDTRLAGRITPTTF